MDSQFETYTWLYGLSNLMINIFKVVEGDNKKDCKNINIISFKKELKTVLFNKISLPTLPEKWIFSQTKDKYKKII